MTDEPNKAEYPFALLRDGSYMDDSLVQRLRATEEISLEWAEQMLDVLIRLDDDLQAFDARVRQQIHSLQATESLSSEERAKRLPGLEEMADHTEQSIQCLRNGVRDVMMSMQQQDVIGQAIARAASALEKRAAAIGRIVEGLGGSHDPTNEIAQIHSAYRTEDDLHREVGLDEAYKAAA